MKLWSISTTVRNPERIRNFLSILKKMEGQIWERPNQKKFQVLLIQFKVYGAGEAQFYKGLTKAQVIILSYNNEGVISRDEIRQTLAQIGSVEIFTENHKRFKGINQMHSYAKAA